MSTNNKIPHIDKAPEKQLAPPKPKVRKPRLGYENYYKLSKIESALRIELGKNKTAAEIAEALNISQSTLYKYKGLLSSKDNCVYTTKEEKAYLSRKKGA